MAQRLQNIVIQTLKTFTYDSEKVLIHEPHYSKLISLVNDAKLEDLQFPPRILKSAEPVDHFALYEDNELTVGVFVMKQGSKIPLHDHPGMYGILKVLSGSLKITSYNIVCLPEGGCQDSPFYYKEPLRAIKNGIQTVSIADSACVLTPKINNIHEVVCESGPAAFLDILTPPYDDDQSAFAAKSCHYFQERECIDGVSLLKQIHCPASFWS